MTYEEQILSDSLPGSILIAGAGAIGIEFAYILNSYGVDVTIVEFLDRVLPLEDEEVSAELAKRYKRAGIKVLTGTRVESIDDSAGSPVSVVVSKGGEQQTLQVDKVLQAIGFAPRVEGYGLEKTGVELTDRGAIAIDDFMHTNVAQHLRDRRRDRQAAARPRRRGHGHHRRGDDRRRGDDGARLRDDAAGDLLPAAGRQLRLDREAGPGAGPRRPRRQVPVHGQRQGARPGRHCRVRQADQRRRRTASCSVPT